MRNKLALLPALFILFCASSAWAETTVKAEVDKTSITTDEFITYKLTITSTERDIAQPQLPSLKDFTVVSQEQSSTFSFQRKGTKAILTFTYILTPQAVGKFKIEPAQIKITDKIYSSEMFEIEVKPGQAKPKNPSEQNPTLPQESPPESEAEQVTL